MPARRNVRRLNRGSAALVRAVVSADNATRRTLLADGRPRTRQSVGRVRSRDYKGRRQSHERSVSRTSSTRIGHPRTFETGGNFAKETTSFAERRIPSPAYGISKVSAMTVPQRLARNYGALVSLNKLSEVVRTHLLPALSADTILALVDCAKNIIIRNVPLSEAQLERLRKHRKALEEIVRGKTSRARRVKLFQEGRGLLSSILGPILSVLTGSFGKR